MENHEIHSRFRRAISHPRKLENAVLRAFNSSRFHSVIVSQTHSSHDSLFTLLQTAVPDYRSNQVTPYSVVSPKPQTVRLRDPNLAFEPSSVFLRTRNKSPGSNSKCQNVHPQMSSAKVRIPILGCKRDIECEYAL